MSGFYVQYHFGLKYPSVASNWNYIPSVMVDRGQIMYNAPTGCRTHKMWYPMHKQDEAAKRLAMSLLLAADPAERWVLICTKHCECWMFTGIGTNR